MKEHVWIPSREGKHLSAMLHRAEQAPPQSPFVILCHGFHGEKVGPNQLLLRVAQALAAAGCHALRFDFAGSGEGEGEFATDTTYSGWLEDLRNVLAWVQAQPEFSAAPVYLFGLSLGGSIVLLHQADAHPIAGRIALAPVVHPAENFRELIGPHLWEQLLAGVWVTDAERKGYALAPSFATDLLEKKYEPLQAAASCQEPLLLLHGTGDIVVPFSGSQELLERYAGEKEFVPFPDVDHVFTGEWEKVCELVLEWFQRHSEKELFPRK